MWEESAQVREKQTQVWGEQKQAQRTFAQSREAFTNLLMIKKKVTYPLPTPVSLAFKESQNPHPDNVYRKKNQDMIQYFIKKNRSVL